MKKTTDLSDSHLIPYRGQTEIPYLLKQNMSPILSPSPINRGEKAPCLTFT